MRRLIASLIRAAPARPRARRTGRLVPGRAVDGPAEIEALGDVDLARDGTGGVVYLKRDGGVPHVFLSRLDRRRLAAAREGLEPAAPVTEAASPRPTAAGWPSAGSPAARCSRPSSRPRGRRRRPPRRSRSAAPGATGVDIDMGVNDVGYAVWSAGGDVRAARLQDTTWTPLAGRRWTSTRPRSAGQGALRPRVAVSAEGYAVATWGEPHADGRHARVGAPAHRHDPVARSRRTSRCLEAGRGQRRLARHRHRGRRLVRLGRVPPGHRRALAHGRAAAASARCSRPRSRSTAGSASDEPRIDITGKGIGGAVAAGAGNAVLSAYLDKFDAFQPAVAGRRDAERRRSRRRSSPPPSAATRVAWRTGARRRRRRAPRRKDGEKAFEPRVRRLQPRARAGRARRGRDRRRPRRRLRGGDGPGRAGRAPADGRGLRPPAGDAVHLSSIRYRARKPLISGPSGSETGAVQTFTVVIDGKVIGRPRGTARVPARARAGRHRWQVERDRSPRPDLDQPHADVADRLEPADAEGHGAAQRPAREDLRRSRATAARRAGPRHGRLRRQVAQAAPAQPPSHRYKRGRFTLKVAPSTRPAT